MFDIEYKMAMLQNYLKIALRNLSKNRLYAFLNIVGLTIGLSAGIIVLAWITDELNYDKFNTNLPNIHLILQNQTQGGETFTFQSLPGQLAGALLTDIPEIKRAARTSWRGKHLLNLGEKSTYETGFYAEPDLFKIFTFPTIKGDPIAALSDGNSIVITERTAHKFFGNEEAIGKIIRHNNLKDYKVGAVLKDIPTTSTIQFDVLFPFQVFEKESADWITSWQTNGLPMWVELHPATNLTELNGKLENFVQTKDPETIAHIFAYPLSEWRLWGKFKNGKQNGGRIYGILLLGIIGAFVLLIACINFMNLATARSERRAREVGVRKVMGAPRRLIIGQFLTEALVMTFIALVLSIILAKSILPPFNRLTEKNLVIDFSNWQQWSAMLALGLLTGLLAGSYPAFFLSAFQPVRVLKGAINTGKSGSFLRKSLVSFQFFISILLIICTIVISRQVNHIQNRPLGYDAENLIEIPARGEMMEKFGVLKNDLLQIPGISGTTAGSDNLISFGSNTSGIGWPGKTDDQNFLISVTHVHYDWTKTVGVKLLSGRDFSPEYGSDTLSCLLNETAVKQMGLHDPVGLEINQGEPIKIIGVVEDFVNSDASSAPSPMVIYLNPGNMSHFFVRFRNDNNWKGTLAQIETAVKKHNPNYPFEFHFTKEEYQKSFEGVRSTGQMAYGFGGISILISCLGLFGLSAFVAERRTKEVGIRKVLGASISNIWFSLSKDFLAPVLFAFVIAAPLAGFLMEKVLKEFDYRIELQWDIFAIAGVVAVCIAIFTVSFQGIKAALANPVHSLRNE